MVHGGTQNVDKCTDPIHVTNSRVSSLPPRSSALPLNSATEYLSDSAAVYPAVSWSRERSAMPKPKGKPAAKQPNAPPIYAPKDLVLGKVRGYPSWPGWIVDPVDAPPRVKAERPGKGGAKTSNLFSLVQFFPTGDLCVLSRAFGRRMLSC